MARILLIEDDADTAREVAEALDAAGIAVDHRATGDDGLRAALTGDHDAVVLDRLLPGGLDGLTILERLRQAGRTVPVLVVSALAGVDDKVRGLRTGGDDYLTKPFALEELVARVEAQVRRHGGGAPASSPLVGPLLLRVGPLELDLRSQRVTRAGRAVEVTRREFRLLEYFARNAGQLLTRSMLYEAVWDYKFDPGTNLIDVHIGRLRRKIDLDGEASLIVTVRGAGWMVPASAIPGPVIPGAGDPRAGDTCG